MDNYYVLKSELMIKKLQRKIILLLFVMIATSVYFLMRDSEKTAYFNWFQGHITDSTAIISVYDFGEKCSKSDFKFHSLNCDSIESTYMGNQLYINKIYLKWSSRNDVKIEYKNSQNEMHSLTLKLSKDSLKIIVGSCIYQFQGLKKYGCLEMAGIFLKRCCKKMQI